MFKNLKAAKEMMANLDPEELQDLMGQAKNYQKDMEEMVRKIVLEEIEKQNLVRKEDLDKRLN